MENEEFNIRLNLIPPEKKKEIAKSNHLKLVIGTEFFLTLIIVCFFGVLLSLRYILSLSYEARANFLAKGRETEQYERIMYFDEQFKKINKQVSAVISVKKDQLFWSFLLEKLSQLVFSGIEINTLDTNDYLVSIIGTANSRNDLILFKEKLESEKCFSDIDLPISDLVNKDNVEFQIDFKINQNCLKK